MASNEDTSGDDENKGFFKQGTGHISKKRCIVCDLIVSECNCNIQRRPFHVELDLSNGGSSASSKSPVEVICKHYDQQRISVLKHSFYLYFIKS